jgi:hypothetical protein
LWSSVHALCVPVSSVSPHKFGLFSVLIANTHLGILLLRSGLDKKKGMFLLSKTLDLENIAATLV